ncbi:hypothetical protein Hanom_Chr10g00922501 [Helianthus anomalus]
MRKHANSNGNTDSNTCPHGLGAIISHGDRLLHSSNHRLHSSNPLLHSSNQPSLQSLRLLVMLVVLLQYSHKLSPRSLTVHDVKLVRLLLYARQLSLLSLNLLLLLELLLLLLLLFAHQLSLRSLNLLIKLLHLL